MSSFNAEITVLSASIGAPTEEALEAGIPPHIELAISPGLTLPFANPQTGEPVAIPLGKLRFNFPRDTAIETFEAALKAAQELPEKFTPSGKVMVAQNMSAVAAAAEEIKRVTGK